MRNQNLEVRVSKAGDQGLAYTGDLATPSFMVKHLKGMKVLMINLQFDTNHRALSLEITRRNLRGVILVMTRMLMWRLPHAVS